MKKTVIGLVAGCLLTGMALSACGRGAITEPPIDVSPEAIYTSAVKTIEAQLTEAAVTSVATQSPLETPTSLPATAEATETATPSPTETPTPTEEVTQTATPTPTSPAGDPRQTLGNPIWRETFDGDGIWYTFEDEHIRMQGVDGNLEMTAFNPDLFDGWVLTGRQADNFYLEVTGTFGDCQGLDRYGLFTRGTTGATAGYLYGFSCDGRYSFWIWDGEKKVVLVDWKASEDILAGANQTNRIGLKAEGDHFSFYANGNMIGEMTDDTYTDGGFGVFVGAARIANFTVKVEELDYWELP